MTNNEIIISEAIKHGIYTKAEAQSIVAAKGCLPIHTFAEWKKAGYSVKRGEHAAITCDLWKYTERPGKAAKAAAQRPPRPGRTAPTPTPRPALLHGQGTLVHPRSGQACRAGRRPKQDTGCSYFAENSGAPSQLPEKFHPAENRKRDDYVFYAYGGPQRPMSPDTVAAFVKNMENLHGTSAHPFRNGTSPHAAAHTGNAPIPRRCSIGYVSEFLGHAQIETTKIYAHADTEMKRKAIQQAANKLNDTIPDALWNTDDEEMMLKLRGKQQYKENIIRSFYAEILALQGFPAGLRASYFIRDKSGKEIRRREAGILALFLGLLFLHLQ
ncbi:MAG: tyrosine-type recombinase/integrase [Acutalibacteraceae bacterium]